MIINIASINVDGLCEVYRRQKFFEIFKGSNCDIFLVQETHIDKKKIEDIQTNWGDKCMSLWNPAPSAKSC